MVYSALLRRCYENAHKWLTYAVWSMIGNHVYGERRIKGSNPLLSASGESPQTIHALRFSGCVSFWYANRQVIIRTYYLVLNSFCTACKYCSSSSPKEYLPSLTRPYFISSSLKASRFAFICSSLKN